VRGLNFIRYNKDFTTNYDELKLWDFLTPKETGRMTGNHNESMIGVAYSPDGSLLSTAGQGWVLSVWECDPREVARVRNLGGYAVAFSPDGRLVTGGQNREAHV
jgi:WD40 repeat protein